VLEQGQGGFGTCFVGLSQNAFGFPAPARFSWTKKIRAKRLRRSLTSVFEMSSAKFSPC
jgi:hypothetical protein